MGITKNFLALLLFTLWSATAWADAPYAQFSVVRSDESIDVQTGLIDLAATPGDFQSISNLTPGSSVFGFTFGFGELLGNTSRFEWTYEYFPEIKDIYNTESETYLQWSNVIGADKVNNMNFSKSAMGFNFTFGFSDDPELVPFVMVGVGVTMLSALQPEAKYEIPDEVVRASRFTLYTLNYGAGFEGLIDEYWFMEIGYRVNRSLHSVDALYATKKISIEGYRTSGLYMSFRVFFDRR